VSSGTPASSIFRRFRCIEILEGVFELEAAVVVVSFDPAVVDSVPTTGHIEEIFLVDVVTARVWSVFRRDRFGVPLLFEEPAVRRNPKCRHAWSIDAFRLPVDVLGRSNPFGVLR
jgi:hypothetical protein